MADREKQLYFTGTFNKAGRPRTWVDTVPARDLSAKDIQRLSDEQYERVVTSGLYQKTEPSSRKQDRTSEVPTVSPPVNRTVRFAPEKETGSDDEPEQTEKKEP